MTLNVVATLASVGAIAYEFGHPCRANGGGAATAAVRVAVLYLLLAGSSLKNGERRAAARHVRHADAERRQYVRHAQY